MQPRHLQFLEDGSLDLPDDDVGRLDLVVGAAHSQFNLSRAKQTERILRAMDHPHFTILAHPSGRLIPDREPYYVDMPGSSGTPLAVAAISSSTLIPNGSTFWTFPVRRRSGWACW